MKIDITGIDKAELVSALFNVSKPVGLGFLVERHNKPMTQEDAQHIIDTRRGSLCFDYLQGRVMKVDLTGDQFDSGDYDRDNGQGRAQQVVDTLKKSFAVSFQQAQPSNSLESVAEAGRVDEALAQAQIEILWPPKHRK